MIARAALFALCLLAVPLVSAAQPPTRVPRLGYLSLNVTAGDPRPREAFRQALSDLGYTDGKNLVIEYRDAAGNPERLPALARELVALKVDVILSASGTASALAAKQATTTIPVVFAAVGDPVGERLVASLARPGGNVTGLAVNSPELGSKSLELLKQAIPGATRVALLFKPDAMPEHARKERLNAWEAAARTLGLQLRVLEARAAEDLERAFSDMARGGTDAVTVVATPLFDSHRRRLAELAARHRIPAVYTFKSYVESGGLMSYGPEIPDLFRRAAAYVDKILKGATPGDLPVEEPIKFELVINRKTARTLGLTIPPALLQRADHLIE
ncbi:MAG TPA: ABC transporter substrate-binding protein [Methylomirabilota bacterium]|nr:ABC transporter substrate-binding protein [Methylomirabilota bacterium]